jgi:hypothetical protein
MNRVLMVGSAEQSGGGVASVLRLMKTMPFWKKISVRMARNADSAWIWREIVVCVEGLLQSAVYDMAV